MANVTSAKFFNLYERDTPEHDLTLYKPIGDCSVGLLIKFAKDKNIYTEFNFYDIMNSFVSTAFAEFQCREGDLLVITFFILGLNSVLYCPQILFCNGHITLIVYEFRENYNYVLLNEIYYLLKSIQGS